MTGIAITGWGLALPDRVVTNDDLSKTLDTSDGWITERTGIKRRHIGGTTEGLATEAGAAALRRAGLDPVDIGLFVLCTCTPDQAMPATSARVQDLLGLRCGAFDLNAACSGFVYGLTAAAGMIATGVERVLLVGAETMSRIVDWEDRNTAVLFADGAGALVLEATPGDGNLLSYDLGADGSLRDILYTDVGSTIRMEGKEVFRRAVRMCVESIEHSLERAKVEADDIALFVPHQANTRIIDAVCSRIGIPYERAAIVLPETGNTSAASIPIALATAADEGRLSDGDLVLLCGFGAGMTWATAVVRWGPPPAP